MSKTRLIWRNTCWSTLERNIILVNVVSSDYRMRHMLIHTGDNMFVKCVRRRLLKPAYSGDTSPKPVISGDISWCILSKSHIVVMCALWSESSLGAQVILLVLSCYGSNYTGVYIIQCVSYAGTKHYNEVQRCRHARAFNACFLSKKNPLVLYSVNIIKRLFRRAWLKLCNTEPGRWYLWFLFVQMLSHNDLCFHRKINNFVALRRKLCGIIGGTRKITANVLKIRTVKY